MVSTMPHTLFMTVLQLRPHPRVILVGVNAFQSLFWAPFVYLSQRTMICCSLLEALIIAHPPTPCPILFAQLSRRALQTGAHMGSVGSDVQNAAVGAHPVF